MSIRWQIALALGLVAAAVGAAAGTAAYVTAGSQLRTSVDESLATVTTRTVSSRGGPGPDGDRGGPGEDARCPDVEQLAPATDVQVVPANGSATACATSADGQIPLPEQLADGYRTVDQGGVRYRVLVTSTSTGHVQVARSLTEVDQVLSRLLRRLVALVAVGVGAALLAGWLIARGIARSIIGLRDTAEEIAATGDLDTEVPIAGASEIASLGTSITTMVQALGRSREQQRRLIDDASHEMRTPLTSLRTNIEFLEHFERIDPAERAEVLDAIGVDVGELSDLLAELVELASDRSDDAEAEPFSLPDLADQVSARVARRSGRSIAVERSPGDLGLVVGQEGRIERAMANLLDNAVKYSPPGTDIVVEVSATRFQVADRGPGIDPADQPYVFDRFFRATEARTAPGSGLGLAIVRQVLDQHGGRTWTENRSDGPGAVVGFELPG